MANPTYNNNQWSPEYFEKIFSAVIMESNILSGSKFGLMPGVKTSQKVTTKSGSISSLPYQEDVDLDAVANLQMTFTDVVVTPEKRMFIGKVSPSDLLQTRFGDKKFGAGALSLDISEFEEEMLDTILPLMQREIEESFVAGIVADLTASSASLKIAGTGAMDETNVVAKIKEVYKKLPKQIRHKGARIVLDESAKDYILLANLADNYKDRVFVNGDSFKFLNAEIVFAPMPDPETIIAGLTEEMVFATDVLGDQNNIVIGTKNIFSESVYYKSVYSAGHAVAIPEQKVIYTVAG